MTMGCALADQKAITQALRIAAPGERQKKGTGDAKRSGCKFASPSRVSIAAGGERDREEKVSSSMRAFPGRRLRCGLSQESFRETKQSSGVPTLTCSE